jgi:hypothetical protein
MGERRPRIMPWYLLMMEAPLFNGDKTYNAVAALVVFLVGMGIYFKSGNRLGWLFIVAALVWTYLTFQDLLFG